MIKHLARFVIKYAWGVTAVALVLSIVSGYYSVELYKNLRTDIEELLPLTARSILDLNEVTSRLQSVDSLAVLVMTKGGIETPAKMALEAKASKRFVTDLAFELNKLPKSVVASVEYKITEEIAFFKSRSALYIDLDDLKQIKNYIADKIDYETAMRNPINIFAEVDIPEPEVDLRSIEQKYSTRTSGFSNYPDGYYATPNEMKRVVIANLPGKSSSVSAVHALKAAAKEAVDRLNPASYSPNMQVLYTGGVQNTIEEQHSLVSDLGMSSVIVLVCVGLAMLSYFKNIRVTAALMLSLFAGTLWTFGLSYGVIGYLNANSAFLGSIIIGNGINFPIILLARYMEERGRGHAHVRALMTAMQHTTTATWTAALAAGLSYGSLTLTSFRGFNQFGVIGLLGMVFCWISGFTVLPALLTVFENMKTLMKKNQKNNKAPIADLLADLIKRFPRPIWIASFVFTLICLVFVVQVNSSVIETDLSKLRDKKSMTEGSGYLNIHVEEIFKKNNIPVVILPKTAADAMAIAKRVKAQREVEGKTSMIENVQTMQDFVPADQLEKIKVLRQIKSLIGPQIRKHLTGSDKEKIDTLLNPHAFELIRQKDLPALVISKFTEKDGTIGKLVVVDPPPGRATLDGNRMVALVHDLRKHADAVAPGTPVAGVFPISADLLEAIYKDGPKAAVIAFFAVVLLVVFLFRSGGTIFLVLLSLILGVTWLCGIAIAVHLKINFLNFIAFPITFGIGVDYGVNIFQRYKEEGSGSIIRVIRDTGGAVGLCSLTTMIGYGSLLLAGNQAFVSFGMFCVLGEVTCLVAALVSLPAYLILRDQRRVASEKLI